MNKEQILAYLEFQDGDVQDALVEMRRVDEVLADPSYKTLSEIQHRAVVSGLALHLQSFYTGLELVLKNTLNKIDGLTPDGDAWHARLLKQANRSTEYRPSLISEESLRGLDGLRGFRHVVRNLYGTSLDPDRVLEMVEIARGVSVSFDRDWHDFKQSYRSQPTQQTLPPRRPR